MSLLIHNGWQDDVAVQNSLTYEDIIKNLELLKITSKEVNK